jgi:hypothetical protein
VGASGIIAGHMLVVSGARARTQFTVLLKEANAHPDRIAQPDGHSGSRASHQCVFSLNINALSSSYMDNSEVHMTHTISQSSLLQLCTHRCDDGMTCGHNPAHLDMTSNWGAWRCIEETSRSGGPQIAAT